MTPDAEPVYHRVCASDSLREGIGQAFIIEGRGVAVFLRDGVYHAVSSRCPHNGMSLHDGCLDGTVVTCRWHGWQFDVTTGRPPGKAPEHDGPRIRVYPLRLRDGWVEVGVAS